MAPGISWKLLGGCCHFLDTSGSLMVFPGSIWYFLDTSGVLLLFPGGIWMVTGGQQKRLTEEGNDKKEGDRKCSAV